MAEGAVYKVGARVMKLDSSVRILEYFGLSERVINLLEENGLRTVRSVMEFGQMDLRRKIRNLGIKEVQGLVFSIRIFLETERIEEVDIPKNVAHQIGLKIAGIRVSLHSMNESRNVLSVQEVCSLTIERLSRIEEELERLDG